MVFVYTTCLTLDEAQELSRKMISNKMASCVDFWPISSVYRWGGEIRQLNQVMLMITTLEHRIEDVNNLIPDHTNYSTPLIAGVQVDRMGRSYKEWMIQQVV